MVAREGELRRLLGPVERHHVGRSDAELGRDKLRSRGTRDAHHCERDRARPEEAPVQSEGRLAALACAGRHVRGHSELGHRATAMSRAAQGVSRAVIIFRRPAGLRRLYERIIVTGARGRSHRRAAMGAAPSAPSPRRCTERPPMHRSRMLAARCFQKLSEPERAVQTRHATAEGLLAARLPAVGDRRVQAGADALAQREAPARDLHAHSRARRALVVGARLGAASAAA